MISMWPVNLNHDAMLRNHSPLIVVAGFLVLQAHAFTRGLVAADTAPTATLAPNPPPPREVDVFPFLKDGRRPAGIEPPTATVGQTVKGTNAAAAATSARPTPSGYLNRLGVPGASTLRFQEPPSLVEESIPLPSPPMLKRPLISASYSRGPMEWEGTQPTPLRPVSEIIEEPVTPGAIPPAKAQPPQAQVSAPVRVEAGGGTGAPSVEDTARISRPASEFQAITPFFQVSPLSAGSTPPGLILQFVAPDTRPSTTGTPHLKSRAVYESK